MDLQFLNQTLQSLKPARIVVPSRASGTAPSCGEAKPAAIERHAPLVQAGLFDGTRLAQVRAVEGALGAVVAHGPDVVAFNLAATFGPASAGMCLI